MKACVKAWQAVVNPATGKVHDEAGPLPWMQSSMVRSEK